MTRIRFLLSVFVIFGLVACSPNNGDLLSGENSHVIEGGLGISGADSNEGENEPVDEDSTEKSGGFSAGNPVQGGFSAGNPLRMQIRFNLAEAEVLTLSEVDESSSESNLDRVAEGTLWPVISRVDESSDEEASSLPQVQEMFVGPEQELVLLMDRPVDVGGEGCQFLRVDSEGADQQCISQAVTSLTQLNTPHNLFGIPGGHRSVQFNSNGDIFFTTNSLLYYWDERSQLTELLSNPNFLIEDFLLTDLDSIFFEGRRDGEMNALGFISEEGSSDVAYESQDLYTIELGPDRSEDSYVMFSDASGPGALEFTSDQFGDLQLSEIADGEVTGLGFFDFQSTNEGMIFAMRGSFTNTQVSRELVRIYPPEPETFYPRQGIVDSLTELSHVRFFKTFGDQIYVVGETRTGNNLFTKVASDDADSEERFLSGVYRVHDFVVQSRGGSNHIFVSVTFKENRHLILKIVDHFRGSDFNIVAELDQPLRDLHSYPFRSGAVIPVQ